jgi:hypothetical protein
MNERTLEIIVRRCPEAVFGPGWELRAQQLSLPSGRIDLLFADSDGVLQLVELKKGDATVTAVDQVLAYCHDMQEALDGAPVVPWVVAHGMSQKTVNYAEEHRVQLLAVPLAKCAEIAREKGLSEADLIGRRKDGKVINGGGAKRGLRNSVPNEVAYAAMPVQMVDWLRRQEAAPRMDLASGSIQTVLHYRGVKLGGVNRTERGGVAYIASGVILTPEHEQHMTNLGFRRMTKTQSGSSHEHIWWEILSSQVDAFASAVEQAQNLVDRTMGVK